jgi:uncharacterized membrane protein YqaE (UPF0057 family)
MSQSVAMKKPIWFGALAGYLLSTVFGVAFFINFLLTRFGHIESYIYSVILGLAFLGGFAILLLHRFSNAKEKRLSQNGEKYEATIERFYSNFLLGCYFGYVPCRIKCSYKSIDGKVLHSDSRYFLLHYYLWLKAVNQWGKSGTVTEMLNFSQLQGLYSNGNNSGKKIDEILFAVVYVNRTNCGDYSVQIIMEA